MEQKDKINIKRERDTNGRFIKGVSPWNKGLPKELQPKFNKKCSQETKIKIGQKHRGKNISIEQRISISKAHLGKTLSLEHKQKISKGNLGKIVTTQTREKIRNKLIGHKVSKETIDKIIQKVRGRKETEEQRRNKSMRMKQEYLLGLRKPFMQGKVFSPEERKKMSIRMSLDKHPNWLGGKSFEPYSKEFNERFKELIKIRDNYSCIICGSSNRLAIHHVDYNKLNSIKENCVCLCESCHTKTNFNREHWTKFFYSFLNTKYLYSYLEVNNNVD
jgi:5-methylcytosine-specific restriction endonuclease McrA